MLAFFIILYTVDLPSLKVCLRTEDPSPISGQHNTDSPWDTTGNECSKLQQTPQNYIWPFFKVTVAAVTPWSSSLMKHHGDASVPPASLLSSYCILNLELCFQALKFEFLCKLSTKYLSWWGSYTTSNFVSCISTDLQKIKILLNSLK